MFVEHVWQVTVKPKGLGSSKGLSGNYRLCLTTTTINLVKMNCEDEDLEFSVSNKNTHPPLTPPTTKK